MSRNRQALHRVSVFGMSIFARVKEVALRSHAPVPMTGRGGAS